MIIDHVTILEPTPHTEAVCQILGPHLHVTRGPMTRAALLSAVEGTDALFARLGHQLDQEVFSRSRRLRVVATPTTGLTHIDMSAAEKAGVDILCLRGERELLESLPATGELTWGLLLAVARRITAASRHTSDGGWDRNKFWGHELAGWTLGIIGLGRVGRSVARYAVAFGMRVIAFDSRLRADDAVDVRLVTKDELLRTADVVSIHAEYNQGDAPLVGAKELAAMKERAILINTARGELVDEDALAACIISGRLSGAGLDVLHGEPAVSPDLVRLQRTHNVVITPHLGGATVESIEKTELFMARKLKAYIEQVNGRAG